MEQTKEVKKPNLHPMRERAVERVARVNKEEFGLIHAQERVSISEPDVKSEIDPEDAFVIRLVLDVVAGRSDRLLFDEAGDLKEGCQSTALLVVAEGLMQCFDKDLSVKDGLMLKLSLTAMSACGYYPDIKAIPAENPHPDGEELDYDNPIEVTAEPESKISLEVATAEAGKLNQFDINRSTSEQESDF